MSRFYARDVFSGIAKDVNPINENLTVITLSQLVNGAVIELGVPVYMQLGQEYVGRPVDIITERVGFLGGTVKQTVEASNSSNSVRLAYSRWKKFDFAVRESWR
jgi:hypothetical protein